MEKYQQSTQSSSQVITKESHLQVNSWPKESYKLSSSAHTSRPLNTWTTLYRSKFHLWYYYYVFKGEQIWWINRSTMNLSYVHNISIYKLSTVELESPINTPRPHKITNKQPMSATKMQIFSKKDQLKQNIYCYTRL